MQRTLLWGLQQRKPVLGCQPMSQVRSREGERLTKFFRSGLAGSWRPCGGDRTQSQLVTGKGMGWHGEPVQGCFDDPFSVLPLICSADRSEWWGPNVRKGLPATENSCVLVLTPDPTPPTNLGLLRSPFPHCQEIGCLEGSPLLDLLTRGTWHVVHAQQSVC